MAEISAISGGRTPAPFTPAHPICEPISQFVHSMKQLIDKPLDQSLQLPSLAKSVQAIHTHYEAILHNPKSSDTLHTNAGILKNIMEQPLTIDGVPENHSLLQAATDYKGETNSVLENAAKGFSHPDYVEGTKILLQEMTLIHKELSS